MKKDFKIGDRVVVATESHFGEGFCNAVGSYSIGNIGTIFEYLALGVWDVQFDKCQEGLDTWGEGNTLWAVAEHRLEHLHD